MAWMEGIFGTDLPVWAQYTILAAIALVALLLIIWLFRKIFASASSRYNKNRQPRLSVTDAAVVDDKRRLILVRRDHVEHLVMIGGPSDIVVEQNIVRAVPVAAPQTTTTASPAPTPAPVPANPEPASTPSAPETRENTNPAAIGGAAAAAGAGLAATASDKMDDAKQTVSSSGEAAAAMVSDTAATASQTVSDTAATATSSITGLTEKAASTVSDAGENVSEAGSNLAEDLGAALGVNDSPAPDVSAEAPDASSHQAPEIVADEPAPSKTEDEMQKLLKELDTEKR